MTWLYIPSKSVPASACSEKPSGLDLNTSELPTEPFVTWSGKPVLAANLSRLWKREPSIRRLSGLTYSRSEAETGAAQWIASLRVSRAKTCPLRAAGLGSTESAAGSSSTSWTLPTIAKRDSSFWRTSEASLLPPPPLWTKPKGLSMNARPPESWENWPTAGGMRNGCIFQRPKWAPAMSESDGFALPGAWPTPDCNTSTYSNGHMGKNIREAASQWLTPNVPNVPNGGRSVSAELVASKGMTDAGEKKTVGLESQTKHWATPTNNEHTGAGHPDSKQGALNLRSQVNAWPTPRGTDGTKGGPNQAGSKGDLMLPSAAAQWNVSSAGTNSQSTLGATDAPTAKVKGSTTPVLARPTPAARDAKGANSSEHVTTNGTGRMHMDQLPNFVEHHFLRLGQQTQSGETLSTPVVSVHGAELSPTTRPGHVLGRLRLNPAFGCWLMGWPWWWTNPGVTSFAKSEMVLYRSALQQRLCTFFDGRE